MTTNSITNLPEAPVRSISRTSLNRSIIKTSLLGVTIGMVAYTSIEFLLDRPSDIPEFLTHHLLHMVVIGLLLTVIIPIMLNRLIVVPVRLIFRHLYHMSSGRFSHLNVDSEIEEVNTVVEGINLLVKRLKQAPEDRALIMAVENVNNLRSNLNAKISAAGDSADEFMPIMTDLRKLEQYLLSVVGTAREKS